MRENINKVSQRGENLDSLQDKTDNLAVSAQGFRRGANRVRKDMWWKDMKMRVCLVICVIVLLIVIIVPSGKHFLAFPYLTYQLATNTVCSGCHQALSTSTVRNLRLLFGHGILTFTGLTVVGAVWPFPFSSQPLIPPAVFFWACFQ